MFYAPIWADIERFFKKRSYLYWTWAGIVGVLGGTALSVKSVKIGMFAFLYWLITVPFVVWYEKRWEKKKGE